MASRRRGTASCSGSECESPARRRRCRETRPPTQTWCRWRCLEEKRGSGRSGERTQKFVAPDKLGEKTQQQKFGFSLSEKLEVKNLQNQRGILDNTSHLFHRLLVQRRSTRTQRLRPAT